MNTKKVISHFMMDIMDEARKGRERLHKFVEDLNIEDDDKYWEIVDVCLRNIDYYARIILENEDAL